MTQSGFTFADTYTQWYKWEMMTPDVQSNQTVVRKQSSIRWNNKPWAVWRYIEKWAVETLQNDGKGMSAFLNQGAA